MADHMYVVIVLYFIPMILGILFCLLNSIYGKDKKRIIEIITVSVIPVANIVILFETHCSYDTPLDLLRKIKLPSHLSEEATDLIKESKAHRDREIEKIKKECNITIQEIKQEDEQKILLNKLGLTIEDLETIKSMKKEK